MSLFNKQSVIFNRHAEGQPIRSKEGSLVFQTAEHAKPIGMQLVGPSLGGVSWLVLRPLD